MPERAHRERRRATQGVATTTTCGAWKGDGVEPRRYEFRVAGLLSERTRGAFCDMTIVDAPPETIISGKVLDEAHLYGVLALIQDLGLTVVSVNQVPR
jgi:hypothetical protein